MCDEEGAEAYCVDPNCHWLRVYRPASLAVRQKILIPAVENCPRDTRCFSSIHFFEVLLAEPEEVSGEASLPGMGPHMTRLLKLKGEAHHCPSLGHQVCS